MNYRKEGYWGLEFLPAMNFFEKPVPNMIMVESFLWNCGNCDTCPHLKECRAYWDRNIAGDKTECGLLYKDITPEKALEAIDYYSELRRVRIMEG